MCSNAQVLPSPAKAQGKQAAKQKPAGKSVAKSVAPRMFLLGASAASPTTFCNPVNINYRFSFVPPSHREAADPTMVVHNGTYWLFPSKSGGYWQ